MPIDDHTAPLYTVGQVAGMLGVQPARSAGGQRRYSGDEIAHLQRLNLMTGEGLTLGASAACRTGVAATTSDTSRMVTGIEAQITAECPELLDERQEVFPMSSELSDIPAALAHGDGTTLRIESGVLDPAVRVSRAGRFDTMEALHALEDALGAPAPRRERTWLHRVLAALDVLSAMLDSQAAGDQETQSLLTEIRREEPRLAPRVDRLRAEQADLRIAITSLRDQLAPDAAVPVDTADIRDRLASLARRLRAQRARESDLVYEAVNVDLGTSD